MEGAGVLCDDIKVSAKGAESAAIDGVRVGDTVDFWAGSVHGVMDYVGCRGFE